MEWVEGLHGAVVGLDTAPLIYFIEEHPDYLGFVRPFFEAADQGSFQIVTSVLTLTEVLVHPLRAGNFDLAEQYRRILLSARQILTLPISDAVAEKAAELRVRFGLRTPDAIQLAAAVHSGASYFLTNDSRLPSLSNLEILVLDDLRKHPGRKKSGN
jgi:predicted nucleic acid-binding protein